MSRKGGKKGSVAKGPPSGPNVVSEHDFHWHTYTSPADCDYCTKFLWGLRNQGLRCKECKFRIHGKCLKKAKKNPDSLKTCTGCRGVESQQLNSPKPGHKSKVAEERLVKEGTGTIDHKHMLSQTTFNSPVPCSHCAKFIVGLTLQGFSCSVPNCTTVLHGECVQQLHEENPDFADVDHTEANATAMTTTQADDHIHNFVINTFTKPTFCSYCSKFIWGLARQGYICTAASCAYPIHKPCKVQYGKDVEHKAEINKLKSTLEKKETELERLASKLNRLMEDDSYYDIPATEVQLYRLLGAGGFGEVYLGLLYGKEVAVKRLIVSNKMTNHRSIITEFQHEVAILKKLHHPNIVMLMGACSEPNNLLIVTEYCHRGSLSDVLHKTKEPISFQLRVKIAEETALSMNWLHMHNPPILHRDLKSANILLDNAMNVKLCDFGISQVFKGTAEVQCVGSPVYMAPEALMHQQTDEKIDVYSYGMCLWEILTNEEPYKNVFRTFEELVEAVVYDEYRPGIPEYCCPKYEALLIACWHPYPEKRPTFKSMLDTDDDKKNTFKHLVEEFDSQYGDTA